MEAVEHEAKGGAGGSDAQSKPRPIRFEGGLSENHAVRRTRDEKPSIPRKSGPPEPDSQQSGCGTELTSLLQRGYRYALSLTHDEARAEDLLQDALVALLRRGPLRGVGYLITTIRNRFIDLYRRERLVVMTPIDEVGEDALGAFNAPDPVIDPERLEQGLATLRPAEREALYLAGVEGYTAQEIANLTRRPRGTVLSLIHRARHKLRAFFGEDHR